MPEGDSNLTAGRYEEVRARAAALLPLVREHAAATERDRKVAGAVIEAFTASGLHRAMRPRRAGGWELGFESLIDMSSTLSQGCASTAWACGLYVVHNWLLALFPPDAQDEIWADNPDVIISGSYAPAAAARPVDGGYRLSGRFSFSSGCPAADWNLCGAMVPRGADGAMVPAFTIVPKRDYAIDWESWRTVGLAGTGSYDVLLDDAFVPAHRVLTFAEAVGGGAPGTAANPNPLYRLPMMTCIPYTLAIPSVGAAKGALDLFVAENRVRETRGAVVAGGRKVSDFQTIQKRIGEAEAMLDAALVVAHRDVREAEAAIVRDGQISLDLRMRNRRSQAFIAHQAVQAVDLIFAAVGGRCVQLDHPIQRAWRDVHAATSHISLNFDAVMSMIGQYRFGLEPQGQY
jgi:alkylation response protein AidB-like acyl-CoA dehydrogenase